MNEMLSVEINLWPNSLAELMRGRCVLSEIGFRPSVWLSFFHYFVEIRNCLRAMLRRLIEIVETKAKDIATNGARAV